MSRVTRRRNPVARIVKAIRPKVTQTKRGRIPRKRKHKAGETTP